MRWGRVRFGIRNAAILSSGACLGAQRRGPRKAVPQALWAKEGRRGARRLRASALSRSGWAHARVAFALPSYAPIGRIAGRLRSGSEKPRLRHAAAGLFSSLRSIRPYAPALALRRCHARAGRMPGPLSLFLPTLRLGASRGGFAPARRNPASAMRRLGFSPRSAPSAPMRLSSRIGAGQGREPAFEEQHMPVTHTAGSGSAAPRHTPRSA